MTDKNTTTALTHATIDTDSRALAMIPSTPEAAWRMAEWLSNAGLFAKRRDPLSVADIFAVILAGVELWMPPMAALRSLYSVNGKTALEGRAKMALCLQRGVALYVTRTEYTPEATTWEMQRRGAVKPQTMRYTLAEAQKAGLTRKDGPWQNYPQRMISHRALGWLLDDSCPDVLLGIATAEDFEDGIDLTATQSPLASFQSLDVMPAPAPKKSKTKEAVSSAPDTAKSIPSEAVVPPPVAMEPAVMIVAPQAEPAPEPMTPAPVADTPALATGSGPIATKPMASDEQIEDFRKVIAAATIETEHRAIAAKISTFDMTKADRDELLGLWQQRLKVIRELAAKQGSLL